MVQALISTRLSYMSNFTALKHHKRIKVCEKLLSLLLITGTFEQGCQSLSFLHIFVFFLSLSLSIFLFSWYYFFLQFLIFPFGYFFLFSLNSHFLSLLHCLLCNIIYEIGDMYILHNNKTNRLKVGMNILSNRFNTLNGKIDLN